jgi:hypothetical protein
MAASVALSTLIVGPPRRIEVAAATALAVYLRTGDPDRPALCLAQPAAVRVPCAVVVGQVPVLAVGIAGTVGDGALSIGPFEGRLGRWWRPPRPRGLVAAGLGAVAAELHSRVPDEPVPDQRGPDGPGPDPEGPDPGAAAAIGGLLRAVAAGGSPEPWLRRLLGRGPGLTPVCDDVLAGALVTLGGLGSPAFAPLGTAVCALAPARTTFVSTALLRHAADGECVPELAAVLTAGRYRDPVARAVDALLGVGGSSGTGLARGVLAALAIAARAPKPASGSVAAVRT